MAQDNPSREAILGRIRSALAKPAPQPIFISHDVALFPPVGDLLERLQKELAANLVDCVLTADAESSTRAVADVLATLPEGEVFVQDAPELRALIQAPDRAIRWSNEGAPSEASQTTISLCEMLVGGTGSVVVSSGCGGRGASIVAPCHIVYAKTSQIVADLDAAMQHIYEAGLLKISFVGFITGASRTGDIEKILVHGAHGPSKVIVVLERDGA
jgi:L-lactate dehydrogenase complex protein LldG